MRGHGAPVTSAHVATRRPEIFWLYECSRHGSKQHARSRIYSSRRVGRCHRAGALTLVQAALLEGHHVGGLVPAHPSVVLHLGLLARLGAVDALRRGPGAGRVRARGRPCARLHGEGAVEARHLGAAALGVDGGGVRQGQAPRAVAVEALAVPVRHARAEVEDRKGQRGDEDDVPRRARGAREGHDTEVDHGGKGDVVRGLLGRDDGELALTVVVAPRDGPDLEARRGSL
mmetsp:Transcript_5426/g.16149  ORF Transcript_5426/g.16149 Transcript_5426/m.16149 type:complete len:230 (-) Transcript_5426:2106-2795(-)